MGCKLLEIMADGLYAVFHIFEAFQKKVDAQAVTVGCLSNSHCASSISALPAPAAQTSAGGTACSLLPAADCAAAKATPPATIPTAGQALRQRQPHTIAEPVNPRTPPRGHPLPRLPRLRVVQFLGLAFVHRLGALRAAWSTWSRNDFHRKSTVRGEADSWVHGHSPVFL